MSGSPDFATNGHIQDDTRPPASDAFQVIDIDGDVVTLHSFQLRNADVAAYLSAQRTDHQESAFIRAVEVGVFCLELASLAKETDFVKRQVERLLHEMESKVSGIPERVRDELMLRIGTRDGQVLKPLLDATDLVTRNVADRIAECRTFVEELLDPTNESPSIGKALTTVGNMLDPIREDSIQGSLKAAITKVTGEDGVLAKSVKAVVEDAIKPLKDEVDSLSREIHGRHAAHEALMQTTAKGAPYEDEVVESLRPWANAVGAELERIKIINRRVSDIRTTADEIGDQVGELRDEIRHALCALEDTIHDSRCAQASATALTAREAGLTES